MTNEQLAEFIQQGGADDLKPVLYDRIKHLMYKLVGQQYSRFAERFNACGVDLSDLRQECYFAFLNALQSFKPADEYKFTAYLTYHLKNVLNGALGIRNTKRLNNKPLDNCQRLDMPLSSEDDSFTLGDTIVDDTSQQAFEDCIEQIQDEQTRQVLSNALNKLDKELKEAIMLVYFEDLTQEEAGKRLGVSGERIRQRKAKALRKLRFMPDVRMLREEQRIERHLHFRSWDNSTAYYKAQEEIAKILKRGDYLSYGKRQAIIYDCRTKQAIADKAEYQSLCLLEKILAEQECKRIL